ncbi:ATP-dependent helicase [Paenibacillus sp. TRM 82003]|nr:ATP-dependent helicase [Paenibacillus sp. TRM 82003]
MSGDFFERKRRELGVRLNDVQRRAVLQTEGPLLLLASPGSGKTTTIIMRIGYLVEEKGVDPSRIKAVTFSKASAVDMKERYRRFFPSLPAVDFSTLHSFAFGVTREHFSNKGVTYRIIEGPQDNEAGRELQKGVILRDVFASIAGEKPTEDQLAELSTYISYIKNKLVPPERWAEVVCGVPQAERMLRAYEAVKRSDRGRLLLDFDDMLTIANEALEADPALLRKVQSLYDYVLTDESQDTSLVQHRLVEKLTAAHRNLCVVADDDQSIYSWRGAEPSYLLAFGEKYPGAAILFMEQNYRSSRDIVDVANRFIKRNKQRYDKSMFTENGAAEPIRFRAFPDDRAQAKYIVGELRDVEDLREVAVLYRNNASSIALMNEFDRAGIPFYMKDADNRFFSHWVVEDVLNFMRMTFTDRRVELLESLYTKLPAYVTKQQLAGVKAAQAEGESVFDTLLHRVPLQDYQAKLVAECKETFEQMRGMPPAEAIRVVRGRLGYDRTLDRLCEKFGFRKDYLVGILDTLEEIADGLPTMESFAERIRHLAATLKQSRFRKDDNAVTFSTFHSSKGLEFERVYLIDLADGVIPSAEDRESGDRMEEAVRLFYVGMTRAKRRLELISYRERGGQPAVESPFVAAVRYLAEPPKPAAPPRAGAEGGAGRRVVGAVGAGGGRGKVSDARPGAGAAAADIPFNPNAIRSRDGLSPGTAVRHRVFGAGEIVELGADSIGIKFTTGLRKLSIAMCLEMGLLEPSGE